MSDDILAANDDEVDTMEEELEEAIEQLSEGKIPERLRWRPVFSWKGLLFGVFADLAIEILFQQFGIAPFEAISVVRGILVGSAIGVAAPSLGAAYGVVMVNREIGRLETDAGGA